MFFGTLTLLFISKFIKSMPSQLWIDLAAISAGITAGSKYNGGLVLILVLVAAFLNLRTNFDKKIFKLIFRIIVFSALSFFLTTPGIIFEWRILLSHLKFQFVTYNSGHFGYTVQSVWQHLFVLCEYFLCSVPSKYLFLSILISSLAILGLLDLFKKDKKNFWILIAFPSVYIGFFCMHKVMIVRNYLILIPFLFILSARGFIAIYHGISSSKVKLIWIFSFVLYVFINQVWLLKAAHSIRINDVNYAEEIALYIRSHPKNIFYASSPVFELAKLGSLNYPNVVQLLSYPVTDVIFDTDEINNKNYKVWRGNEFNYIKKVFGPAEVNLNYYPSWRGSRHILVMELNRALEIGVK
jgi:hypothetical protein